MGVYTLQVIGAGGGTYVQMSRSDVGARPQPKLDYYTQSVLVQLLRGFCVHRTQLHKQHKSVYIQEAGHSPVDTN